MSWRKMPYWLRGAATGILMLFIATGCFLLAMGIFQPSQSGALTAVLNVLSIILFLIAGSLGFPYFILYLFGAPYIGKIVGDNSCGFEGSCSWPSTIILYIAGILLYAIIGTLIGILIKKAGKTSKRKK